MTRIEYLDFGGVRVPEDSVTRVTGYTCDGCGETVVDPVIVQAHIYPWRKPPFGLPQLHFHESCLIACIPSAGKELKGE